MPTIHESVTLLREDHLGLTQLFRTFCTLAARDGSGADRQALVSRIVVQLEHHLRTVEEVVWPALYEEHPGEVARDKAEVTHELIRTLTTQLSEMQADAALFDARVFILMTLTRQTLDAEECELFPVMRAGHLRVPPQEVADGIVRRRASRSTPHRVSAGRHDATDTPGPTGVAPRRPWLFRLMAGGV